MTHLSDDELAQFALGDVPDGAEWIEHVASCTQCGAALAEYSRVITIGHSLEGAELLEPPAGVWEGIHAELGLPDGLREVPGNDRARPRTDSDTTRRPASESLHLAPRRRKPHRKAATALIAAVALVVGLVAGAIGTSLLSRSEDPRLVAEAVLEPFPGWSASGSARLEEEPSGVQRIVVDLEAPREGLREVWLVDPETSGLISLGLLSGSSGSFSLPADIDLTRYSVVDVSQEPDDGDPTHSGDSIVRGSLSES